MFKPVIHNLTPGDGELYAAAQDYNAKVAAYYQSKKDGAGLSLADKIELQRRAADAVREAYKHIRYNVLPKGE